MKFGDDQAKFEGLGAKKNDYGPIQFSRSWMSEHVQVLYCRKRIALSKVTFTSSKS